MLISSPEFKCSREMLTIIAMLSGAAVVVLVHRTDAQLNYSAERMGSTK